MILRIFSPDSPARDEVAVALTHRVFETLMILVHHPGRMVSRDELMAATWPGRYMDESSPGQAIFTLRKLWSCGLSYGVTFQTFPLP